MEHEYWAVAEPNGDVIAHHGVMGSRANCERVMAERTVGEDGQVEARKLTEPRDALMMLHQTSEALSQVEYPDTGQRGIEPAGIEGIEWGSAMAGASDAIEKNDGPEAHREALGKLLDATTALGKCSWDDGSVVGIEQSGVEGLHFGSAVAAGRNVMELTRDKTERPQARTADVEPRSMGKAPDAPKAPEPAGTGRNNGDDGRAGPTR